LLAIAGRDKTDLADSGGSASESPLKIEREIGNSMRENALG
jgi:hypothetical protein